MDVEPAPFLAGAVCTFLWFKYGLMLNDGTMIAVNCFGTILFSCYTLYYYLMTKKHRRRVLGKILLTVGTTLAIVFFSNFMSSDPLFFSGIFACLSSLTFSASPLASIRQVMKSKSAESLPFALIMFGFIVSSLWTSYGVLIDNNFVILPNALAAIISGMQLCLFVLYRKTRAKTKRVSE